MPRLLGPLEFALALGTLGAIGFIVSIAFGKSERYLRALVVLSAFPVAVHLASLIRQMVFELRTDGVLSSQLDVCTVALMPFLVVGLSIVLVMLALGYAALGMLQQRHRSPMRLSLALFFSRNQILGIGCWRAWACGLA